PVRIAPWLLIQPLAPRIYRNNDALLRYPGDYLQFTLNQAKQGYEDALQVKEWVLNKLME
ncbi:MAG: hypothetical protein M3362_17125, partial [Acidobacteriota bacterium]|nr:hypothetical protein [Acidobacteriota bacterium]